MAAAGVGTHTSKSIGTTDEVDCAHGNPNVLTTDAGSSGLAQGSTAHTCLVDAERYNDAVLEVDPFAPPPFVTQ